MSNVRFKYVQMLKKVKDRPKGKALVTALERGF